MLVNEHGQKEDRRVKRSRKLIQQAFESLLAEKDFQSITVQDIAERADVNRATFYAHFEDKYALLTYNVREAFQQMLDPRVPDARTLTLTNLRLLTVTAIEFLAQFSGGCHPTTRSDEHPNLLIARQVQQDIQERLLDWIGSAHVKPDAPAPEQIASMLSWVIFSTAFPHNPRNRIDSPEWMADQMLAFLTPSLQAYIADLDR